MIPKPFSIVLGTIFLLGGTAHAQHLWWWNLEKQQEATCLYGEITVLATNPGIYYCGANWHPGEAAGGYCGIQHSGLKERRTIFSIWDTSPTLHPKVIAADPKTVFSRFGNEGSGSHTHMIWNWKVGETFQFFVQKQAAKQPNATDTHYSIYDPSRKKWLPVAAIENPNGDKKSVTTIGGGLNSFLENFTGKDRSLPKIAFYRLWLGSSPDSMKCLTRAKGDGTWGQLHDAYFLAEGDAKELKAVFSKLEKEYGKPVYGEKGKNLEPISEKAIPATVIDALKHLPHAKEVEGG
jgi:hypothetical protein